MPNTAKIPREILGYARQNRLVRLMAGEFLPYKDNEQLLTVDDLPDPVIDWLDENSLTPAIINNDSLEFLTEDDAMLFALRWNS